MKKAGQGAWNLFTGFGHFRSQRTQAAVNRNRMADKWSIRPGEGLEAQGPPSLPITCVLPILADRVLSQPLLAAVAVGAPRSSWPRPPALLGTGLGGRWGSGRGGAGFS